MKRFLELRFVASRQDPAGLACSSWGDERAFIQSIQFLFPKPQLPSDECCPKQGIKDAGLDSL
jgi:hypothetical protein